MKTGHSRKAIFHHTAEEDLLRLFFSDLLKGRPGVFIDIGGNIPENAVSKQFLDMGWSGVVVEPIPSNANKLRQYGWPAVEEVALTDYANSLKSEGVLYLAGGIDGPHSSLSIENIDPMSNQNGELSVSLSTLDTLCFQYGITEINLLSIDTEGHELLVLKGLTFERFKIDLILVEDWMRNARLHRFLLGKGFKLIRRTGFNNWYVPNSYSYQLSLRAKISFAKKLYLSSILKTTKFFLKKCVNGIKF